MPKFNAQHYNAVAYEIREIFPQGMSPEDFIDDATRIMSRKMLMDQRSILTVLALNLARRFKEDNDRFDPARFLDACSPNVEQYPLSELWAEDDDE